MANRINETVFVVHGTFSFVLLMFSSFCAVLKIL